MRTILLLPLLLGLNTTAFSDAATQSVPERKLQGNNTIVSQHDPKVTVRFPESVQYVGADRWVLYGIADCELHAFVETDKQKNIQQLYWVQFEGYLPTKPDLAHTYDSPRHATIGGLDFFVDTWVKPNSASQKPGSDGEHIKNLIQAKGYHWPAGMMWVRLVHLLDKEKRKELMIIYAEDTASTGHTADDLREGGIAHDRWPAIEQGLIERATKKISIN